MQWELRGSGGEEYATERQMGKGKRERRARMGNREGRGGRRERGGEERKWYRRGREGKEEARRERYPWKGCQNKKEKRIVEIENQQYKNKHTYLLLKLTELLVCKCKRHCMPGFSTVRNGPYGMGGTVPVVFSPLAPTSASFDKLEKLSEANGKKVLKENGQKNTFVNSDGIYLASIMSNKLSQALGICQ